MFNRPHPSKRAKSWRPEPGLLSQNSSRGFATTRWGGADDGFMVDDIKRTKDGFALDEYAQVPLSPQAVQALKRLQAMEPDDNVVIAEDVFDAVEAFHIESWNANAHLPFVVDAYEFGDAFDDGVMVEETVFSETPEAEGSAAQVEPVTETNTVVENAADVAWAASSDKHLDEIEISEAVVEKKETTEKSEETEATQAGEAKEQIEAEANTVEAADDEAQAEVTAQAQEENQTEVETTTEAAEAQAEQEAEPKSAVEAAVDAMPEVSAETELMESDLTNEEVVAPEEMAASVEEVMEDVTLPEPVLAGIDPEEVAQREAAKFAEGLAQGIEQGERQAREAMQQEVQAQCTVLANVTQELHALLKDSKAFYEPLKRLAMHLAEQIVMGELRVSSQAIEQLIQRCLAELDHPAQGLVVVELNPEDKNRLQAQSPELIQGMRLEAVQDMQPGSVRLFANDTVIEDLVEHRLEALAQSMLVDVATWQAQSALTKPVASTQDLESEDVHS